MATPIVEYIAANLLTTLSGITVANGYDNTVTAERLVRLGNRVRDKLVVLEQGDTRRSEDVGERDQYQAIGWFQTFYVTCYAIESESSSTAIETRLNSLRSDVEKAVMVDPHRGNYAVDTFLVSATRVTDAEAAAEAVVVEIEVYYRVLHTSPYTQ